MKQSLGIIIFLFTIFNATYLLTKNKDIIARFMLVGLTCYALLGILYRYF